MEFRKWIMTEQEDYPIIDFNYQDGMITVVLPNGKRYVFSSPGSPYLFDKWKRAIRAHPSNAWRLLSNINKWIATKTPNWEQIEPVPTSAPDLNQGKLF